MDDFARELAEALVAQTSCICDEGNGLMEASWAFKRPAQCDCEMELIRGALDEEQVLHEVQCDTVPCPFCVLRGKVEL